MEYKVIRSDTISYFEKFVNEYLQDGWVLKGDLIVNSSNIGFWYIQVMVKGS